MKIHSFFFDLGNADDLAQKLSWVANHPREVLEITKRGQSVYMAQSWSKEQEKLIRVGTDLLSNGDRTR